MIQSQIPWFVGVCPASLDQLKQAGLTECPFKAWFHRPRRRNLSREVVSAVREMRMVAHEQFYWILPQFSLSQSQWVELTSTHWRSEIFSREILFAFMTHAYNYLPRKFTHFAKKYGPWNQALNVKYLTFRRSCLDERPLLKISNLIVSFR